MKKTFILAFFMMFCSMVFGQDWGSVVDPGSSQSITIISSVTLDGDEVEGTNYILGAFCGNELRGKGTFQNLVSTDNYFAMLLVHGTDGEKISFKLYNSELAEEYSITNNKAVDFTDGVRYGTLNPYAPYQIDFISKPVAKIGNVYFATLQEAVNACGTGTSTITLLVNCDEDVTIKQEEGVNVIIDGAEFAYSGTFTIHGNARYEGEETLTFQNINFVTEEASHYFIDSNSTGSVERYAHNVTVEDCNFTATGAGVNSAAAMRIRQGYDIAIIGGTFTGLHSALQAYGNAGITVDGVTIEGGKNGIAVGTSTGVVIKNSNITATGYGVRADGGGAYDMTLAGNNTIEADLPVVVRKATGAYELTVEEDNVFTASNKKGAAVVFTTGDDGTFVAPASDATATIKGNVKTFGFEAKVGNDYYTTLAKAFAAANSGDTLTFLCDVTGAGLAISKDITVDMGGFNYTINQAVGSTGTESQGFQLLPAAKNVTIQNGNISVAAGTNVVWMFNDYAEKLTVKNVAIDCKNMVWSKSVYLIVANNQHGTNPCPVFNNVTISNYNAERPHALIENNTQLTAQEGLNVVTDPGYSVKYVDGTYKVVVNMVKVLDGDTEVGTYATLAEAIAAATAGNTIQFLADLTEDVAISKNVTIDGAGKTYTGKMSLTTNKGTVAIKNVNFDGKGYNGYAVETRGVYYVTIEDCTAKNYGYGFVQLASATVLTTVKDVVVSDMNYGVKVDYSSEVVLENVDMTAKVAAVLNSNYGEKTITVKNSNLNIYGTWTRNSTIKTNIVFEGANTVGEFKHDAAIDNFKLATKESTLTAPEGISVTTDVAGYSVKYVDGTYKVVANMVKVLNGDTEVGTYATLAEAIAAATAGYTIQFLADITENVNIYKNVTIDGAEFNYTGTMNDTKGSITATIKNLNFVNAGFSTDKTGSSYTFNECTFDGEETYLYPIKIKGAKAINVNNCTVKDYLYGFLYTRSSVTTVKVNTVTVEDCPNYAVYFASGVTNANIEGLTVKNSNNGLIINNTANRALTLKGCKFENVETAINHANGTNSITCTLQGENNFGTANSSEYAKYVLSNTESTLKAVEGLNVKVASSLESAGYMVEYSDGIYYVAEGLLGSGTEEDPFIIDNLHKLIIFRDHVNAGKTKYNAEGVHVALAANIDMDTEDWSENIGDDCNNTFDGIFDGKGFKLSNLNSTETAQKSDGYICTGLFGAIAGNATVKNLTIENVNINTADFTGNNVAAVAGFVYTIANKTVTIENVTVQGDININAPQAYAVGTMAGYSLEAHGYINITDCAVEANDGSSIVAASGSGAIIGHAAGIVTVEGSLVNNIDITAKGLVGGLAGFVSSNKSVLDNNTVKNVVLTATEANWVNSAAIAVGTMYKDGLTVANTTFENVNASKMVGSVYAKQPTSVVPAVQARIADKYYSTLQAAIDAAVSGDEIVLLSDIDLNSTAFGKLDGAYNTYFKVEGKTVTIDLNGMEISGTFNAESMLVGVFSTENEGHLTLVDNSEEKDALVDLKSSETAKVYSLMANYEAGSTITINGGTYNLDKASDSHMYTGGDEGIIVNGGNFNLGNVGTGTNGQPWIFNALGQNQNNVIVNGGTFNSDVNHLFWANEVYVPETLALQNNGDGTWTVVESVAYAKEIGTSTNSTVRKVGYTTLAEAVAAGTEITVVKDAEGAGVVINKDVTIDFGGFNYTINQAVGSTGTESQGFQLLPAAKNVTIQNGNISVAEGTNVVWMFNDYAENLTVKDVTIDCENMVWSKSVYLIVANNQHGTNPCPVFDNVTIVNYKDTERPHALIENNTQLTAQAGLNVVTDPGFTVKYVDGTYKVVANMVKVLDGDTEVGTYATLAEAIAAATAGNTIQFLADITENVNIDKNVTIDGAEFNYTGTMKDTKGSITATIKNLNFVNAGFSTDKTGSSYTFNECTFDGEETYAYPIKIKGAKAINVNNCTVKDYLYGFLYTRSSVTTVKVNTVTVEDCPNYAVYFASGVTNASLENMTINGSESGVIYNGSANRTFKMKNCTMDNVKIAVDVVNGTKTVTCRLEGDKNDFGAATLDQYAKVTLVDENSTLAAPADLNVVSGNADYIVAYEGGVYRLVPGSIWNKTQDKKYGTLQAAIDAAVTGDEIVLMSDIELGDEDIVMSAPLKTMVYVEGKDITLDMNGKAISVKYEGEPHLIGVVCVADAAGLTVKGNGSIEVEGVAYDDQFNVAYVFYKRGTTGHLTIEDGTYLAADLEDSMVYTNGDDIVTINGGTFTLDNVGTQANGFPCIFNTQHQNANSIVVNGGTFNTDVNHQFWANEVYVPETLALQNNGDNTWTVVESVAYVNEIGTSTGSKERKVGYASLADAVKSTGATVTVIKAHETKAPAIVEKDFTINMNGVAVTAAENVYPVIRVQNGANVTVIGEGSIENAADYVFVLGSSDKETSGNLTIENGTFTGMTTVASVTKGLLTINGGEFKVKDGEYGSTYLINCYDANYKDGSAKVAISGGTFYGFNPENNAAEGKGTNFCATGYGAVETGSDIWTVVPRQSQEIAKGWNWFSSYINISGAEGLTALENALGNSATTIKSNLGFVEYAGNNVWYGDGGLTSVSVADMYMINTIEDAEIQLLGELADPSTEITIKKGWNWIGYPVSESTNYETALADLASKAKLGDRIKSRNNGYLEFYENANTGFKGWAGELESFVPGQGYMYYSNSDDQFTFTYSVSASKEEVRANMTTEGNYWVANGASFANNMTMTAVLNVNGVEMTDNYEVAAFAGEEVRGSARPVYVESIDRYVMFMTIYGEGNEELTFKYIDLDTYEVHNLNDMVVYADNAIVGSLSNPMVLCYGTMGIGENGFDTMSLYPNPTRTGRTISLEAICDMVEVFNSLGVKVAEYRNVETIDGIEEAGVYVIRVTNGETVNNCRLIVR